MAQVVDQGTNLIWTNILKGLLIALGLIIVIILLKPLIRTINPQADVSMLDNVFNWGLGLFSLVMSILVQVAAVGIDAILNGLFQLFGTFLNFEPWKTSSIDLIKETDLNNLKTFFEDLYKSLLGL